MAGFLNALSILAPVAPALSDAQDIRTQRQQDAAKFASDQALSQARLTTEEFAAQAEQQRLAQGAAPARIPGTEDYFDDTQGSWMRPSLVNGEFKAVKIPGQAPQEKVKQAVGNLRDAFKAMGISAPESLLADLGYRVSGGTGAIPTTSSLYRPLPGSAGQPRLGADGKSYVRDVVDPATNQIVEQPMPADYKPPAPRPLSPALRFENLEAKRILASQGKGPALTPQESADWQASRSELTLNGVSTATARAIENARYGITNVTDDSGAEVAQTRLNVANAANGGAPFAAGTQGQATAKDKSTQTLALSAIDQVNRMQDILKEDPNLTGPGYGQLTKFQTWLGSQDPDAQQFLVSSLLASEHGVAVFGGRNIHTIQELQNTLGDWRTNPAALSAALQVVKETMSRFANANGRLPGPRGTTPPPAGGGQTVTLKAGGRVYNIPRDQVAEFRKDHPDASR